MHLVADPDGYEAARRRRLPFYRTACGAVEPMVKLTLHPNQVDCPACQMAIQQYMEQQQQAQPEKKEEEDSHPVSTADFDDDMDDMDDFDSSFDQEHGASEPEKPEEPPSDPSPFEAFKPVLDAMLSDLDVDAMAHRWSMAPDDDPDRSTGMMASDFDDGFLENEDFDLRSILSAEESSFISKLVMLSQSIGLEGLSSRVLTLVHNLVIRSLMLERADLHGSVDDGDDDDGEE